MEQWQSLSFYTKNITLTHVLHKCRSYLLRVHNFSGSGSSLLWSKFHQWCITRCSVLCLDLAGLEYQQLLNFTMAKYFLNILKSNTTLSGINQICLILPKTDISSKILENSSSSIKCSAIWKIIKISKHKIWGNREIMIVQNMIPRRLGLSLVKYHICKSFSNFQEVYNTAVFNFLNIYRIGLILMWTWSQACDGFCRLQIIQYQISTIYHLIILHQWWFDGLNLWICIHFVVV